MWLVLLLSLVPVALAGAQMRVAQGDTFYVYESVWSSFDRDIVHSFAFDAPQFDEAGNEYPLQTLADHNPFAVGHPIGVVKAVYFFECLPGGIRLGVRRVALGVRNVAHPDAANRVISVAMCDTVGSGREVVFGSERGAPACANYLSGPVISGGYYSNPALLDSLVTVPGWGAQGERLDINTWPFGGE
ncbi:MAG: hypothetical protein FJY95_17730 [Candidatus Handelsmanbacteria bacterium]|nr:hypothetical protein [Candidatus Handelsmanbacteria bacterium]